jgi:hypothetical protein
MLKPIHVALSIIAGVATIFVMARGLAPLWLGIGFCVYVAVSAATVWKLANSQLPMTGSTGQESQKSPEDIILEIIRTKGQAQRHDFLAVLKLSRTSLGRVLDDMEKTGQIQQIGERKSACYALK